VALTAALTAIAVRQLLGLGWAESLLMGSIIASTDAAAVFFLLRANGLHLQRRVGATLEMESSSNDPIAIFITLTLIGMLGIDHDATWLELAAQLARQVALGGLVGVGWVGDASHWRSIDWNCHPACTRCWLSRVRWQFSPFSNVLGGSGYLAVYLAGVVIGNRPVRAFANVLSVQDAATWLAQMVMFLVLGLLVTPSRLLESAWVALAGGGIPDADSKTFGRGLVPCTVRIS
jgi:cell volume regulation protein A